MDQVIVFTIILISGVVIGMLAGIWLWRQRSFQDAGGTNYAGLGNLQDDQLPGDILAQVQDFLAVGKKIEAINIIRAHTDRDLNGAKTFVEAMGGEAQGQSGLQGHPSLMVDAYIPPDVIAEVRALVTERKLIAAVRLVRQHTPWGLKKSKEFVDRIR